MGIWNYIRKKLETNEHPSYNKEDVMERIIAREHDLNRDIAGMKAYKSECLEEARNFYRHGLENCTLEMCINAAEMDELINFDIERCGLLKTLKVELKRPSKIYDAHLEKIYVYLNEIPRHNRRESVSDLCKCLQKWMPRKEYVNKAAYCYFALIAIKTKHEKDKQTKESYCTLPELDSRVEA